MTLDFQAGSTPLTSRQNPVIYTVIAAAAIIIAVCLALWLILKKRKAMKQTPEWINAQKNRLTKKSDVTQLAQKYNFSAEETEILWYICSKYKVLNIFYLIREFDKTDAAFKKIYQDMKSGGEKPLLINRFLNLRFTLERIFASSSIISSTAAIPVGTKVNYISASQKQTPCTITENTKDCIALEIPKPFFESENRPAELSKACFSFISSTGLHYIFITRIIRYQYDLSKKYEMILVHTSDLRTHTHRHYKRIDINEKWLFSSVKTETDKKNEITYHISERKYECLALNISGGGCCFSANLPIKKDQLLYIEFTVKGFKGSAIGKIVNTKKSAADGIFNLHIKFTKIETETQNDLLAKIYDYQ